MAIANQKQEQNAALWLAKNEQNEQLWEYYVNKNEYSSEFKPRQGFDESMCLCKMKEPRNLKHVKHKNFDMLKPAQSFRRKINFSTWPLR